MDDKQKIKALEDTFKQIEKQYGKGSIMRMSDNVFEDMDVIRTGSLFLDEALGVGGYPRGRIIEIYGPESSGKTTLALDRSRFIDYTYDPGGKSGKGERAWRKWNISFMTVKKIKE